MRLITTLSLTILVLLLASCGMPGGHIVRHDGVVLTDKVEHTTTICNEEDSDPILATAEYRDYNGILRTTVSEVILPGESHNFRDTSDWKVEFSVTYFDPVANKAIGEEMKVIDFEYNSFFNRMICINRMILNGDSMQIGATTNITGIGLRCYDIYGNKFHLARGQTFVYSVKSGPYWLWIEPDRPLLHGHAAAPIRKGDPATNHQRPLMIDHDSDDNAVMINGELVYVGWYMALNEVPEHWRTHYLRRR